jgi:hypothetical protein
MDIGNPPFLTPFGACQVHTEELYILSLVHAVLCQHRWGLRTGRKGPTDLFHFDLVLAMRYKCRAFFHNTSLQCTVLAVEHQRT